MAEGDTFGSGLTLGADPGAATPPPVAPASQPSMFGSSLTNWGQPKYSTDPQASAPAT